MDLKGGLDHILVHWVGLISYPMSSSHCLLIVSRGFVGFFSSILYIADTIPLPCPFVIRMRFSKVVRGLVAVDFTAGLLRGHVIGVVLTRVFGCLLICPVFLVLIRVCYFL